MGETNPQDHTFRCVSVFFYHSDVTGFDITASHTWEFCTYRIIQIVPFIPSALAVVASEAGMAARK